MPFFICFLSFFICFFFAYLLRDSGKQATGVKGIELNQMEWNGMKLDKQIVSNTVALILFTVLLAQ